MCDKISVWISPPKKIRDDISNIISRFSTEFKVYKDLKSYKGPHITLIEIEKEGKTFDDVYGKLRVVGNLIRPFNLKIKNTGYFIKFDQTGKRNYVIYLKILKNNHLIRLKKFVSRIFPNDSVHYKSFTPHITITHSELDRTRFYKALKKYKNFKFDKKFIVNEVKVSTVDKSNTARIESVKLK